MNDDSQYTAAVVRCEASAWNRGHALGKWLPVDERLHASVCEACGAMAYVSRPGYEEHWRVGGTALVQDCLEEELFFGVGG